MIILIDLLNLEVLSFFIKFMVYKFTELKYKPEKWEKPLKVHCAEFSKLFMFLLGYTYTISLP